MRRGRSTTTATIWDRSGIAQWAWTSGTAVVLHNGHGGALQPADGNDAWKSEAVTQLCAMRAPPKSEDVMAAGILRRKSIVNP